MKGAWLVLLSLVPALLWVWHFYRQDEEPEPLELIIRAFFAGVIAVVPAALFEWPWRGALDDPPNLLVRAIVAFAVIGIGEEGAKLLAVYVSVFRRREFNQAIDGIVYAVTASLGFAALENLLYATVFGLDVAPIRAVVTSLAHASFGGIAGLHLGLAKTKPGYGFVGVIKGLSIAALLHGAYDFFIMSGIVHPLASLTLVYFSYRHVSRQIRANRHDLPHVLE